MSTLEFVECWWPSNAQDLGLFRQLHMVLGSCLEPLPVGGSFGLFQSSSSSSSSPSPSPSPSSSSSHRYSIHWKEPFTCVAPGRPTQVWPALTLPKPAFSLASQSRNHWRRMLARHLGMINGLRCLRCGAPKL